SDAEGSRYRIALARVLIRSRAGEAAPPTRTGKAPRRAPRLDTLSVPVRNPLAGASGLWNPLAGASGLWALTLQTLDLPEGGPAVREAELLADKVLADSSASFDAQ